MPAPTAAENVVRKDFLAFRTNGLPAIIAMPRRVAVGVIDADLNFLTHGYPGFGFRGNGLFFLNLNYKWKAKKIFS